MGGNQTINNAWQEGATTSSYLPDPKPGYGTHITEGSAADGWDHNPLGAAVSIKRYEGTTNSWNPLANTNATAVNATPYLLFIRGDRGTSLGTNAAPATATTLRATGSLRTSDQIISLGAQSFTAIGNPYASPINFAAIRRSGVENNFYLWDSKLGGEYGVGGYVLLSYNGSSYDVIPASVSPESQYIQSGQAFLVRSTSGTGGTMIMQTSTILSDAGSDNVFRVAGGAQGNGTPFRDVPVSTSPAGLRISLQTTNHDSSLSVVDEVLASYGSNFSNNIDSLDAHKPANMQENLAISRDGELLMIERRQPLGENDMIQLKLWNTSAAKQYQLEFSPVSLNTTASSAYLSDNYLHTTRPVDLRQPSRFFFSIDADPASANPYRFSVAFKADAGTLSDKAVISMYPNPLEGRSIALSFTNQPQGTYQLELVNSAGQTVYRTQIQHAGGSAVQHLQLTSKPASGTYLLKIANKTTRSTIKVVVD